MTNRLFRHRVWHGVCNGGTTQKVSVVVTSQFSPYRDTAMPSLSELRQRLTVDMPVNSAAMVSQEESLVADVRCRMSPVQSVDRKLGMMLGRDRLSRDFQLRATR